MLSSKPAATDSEPASIPSPAVVLAGQETRSGTLVHEHTETEAEERETQDFESRLDQVPSGSNLDSTGDIDDQSSRVPPRNVDEAIVALREDVQQIPNDHPDRGRRLEHLGFALESRYSRLFDINDLQEAVSSHREAIQLASHSNPDRTRYLANIAITLWNRFHRLDDVRDLDEAIASCEESVQLTPHEHPYYASRLTTLGDILGQRFDSLGDPRDLDRSIARLEEAVQFTPCDHPDRAGRLDNLGTSLGNRFNRLGDVDDIHQAISRQEEAVKLTPLDDPARPSRLMNLGVSLRIRSDRLGNLDDLEQAIAGDEEVLQLTPGDHPSRAAAMASLGNSYGTRFNHLGNLADLERGIAGLEESVRLTPQVHPDRANRLVNLAVAFRARFVRLGNVSDIEQSIANAEEAVGLTADRLFERVNALACLGTCFATRFARFDDIQDLEQAIVWQEETVHLLPHDYAGRPGRLLSLGVSLQCHFVRVQDMGILEKAISVKEEAKQLIPLDHPHRAHCLASLGDSFCTRFLCFGDVRDLDQAISMTKEAVELTPPDHPDLVIYVFALAACHQHRFDHFGDPADLEQEVAMNGKAVQLTASDQPDYAVYLASLGASLQTRSVHFDDASDLARAIGMHEEALRLTTHGSPHLAHRLENLGNAFRIRFRRFGDVRDLDQAIAKQTEAMQLTPDDHISRANRLHTLAISLQARHDTVGDKSALNDALVHFSSAARTSTATSSLRFSAAEGWISCARSLEHDSLLDAYALAIGILPQLAWIGFSLANRYAALRRGAGIVREAASVALELGHPDTAVEWLEQGRFVVWNDILQLRSPLDDLRAEHPALADKLRQVSTALERASAHDQSRIPGTEVEVGVGMTDRSHVTVSLEEQARQHRALAMERDELLKEVHSLPGFERFLLGKTISQLKALAHSGPIVILNASERRCDALIVRACSSDNVLHVPLPSVTLTQLQKLQMLLERVLQQDCLPPSATEPCPDLQVPFESSDATSAQVDDQGKSLDLLLKDLHLDGSGTPATRPLTSDAVFGMILSVLWTDIVKPVIDALGFSTPGELRRIFWCPTGPFAFLPVHAAGLYDATEPGSKLSDFAISSYTPILGALTPIQEQKPNTATVPIRLLAVSQPNTDGAKPLPGTHEEIKDIKSTIESASSAHVRLIESSGTVEDVLEKMTQSDWVHFACHGVQDLRQPVDSGLILAEGHRLTLSEIINLSRPRGGLAFLSACDTAMGDKRLSEEAVHLAAGMLLAGYSSVIATMWQIGDRDAPEVARDVYAELLLGVASDEAGLDEVPDSRRSARALHGAVQRLRERGATFLSWVPFVHIGL